MQLDHFPFKTNAFMSEKPTTDYLKRYPATPKQTLISMTTMNKTYIAGAAFPERLESTYDHDSFECR